MIDTSVVKTVTIHETKTHLSRLLHEVEQGEQVIIARGRTPIARLIPYQAERRRLGSHPGLIVRMDASFDDPLEDFGPFMAAEDPQ